MSADIYSSLVKGLTMSDMRGVSCYPVRVTAAAAIAQLVENEYMPPEWLPLLQVVFHWIGDEEENSSIYFQLLSIMVEAGNEKIAPHIPDIVCLLVRDISKKLPLDLEPWPQRRPRARSSRPPSGHSSCPPRDHSSRHRQVDPSQYRDDDETSSDGDDNDVPNNE